MPQATSEFPFERKIAAWCGTFSKAMTGNPLRAFFVSFDERGGVARVVFAEGKTLEPGREAFLQSCSKGWLCWRPFDTADSCSVGWGNVSREAMESLLGERFPEEELVSDRTACKIEFPKVRSVVFAGRPRV